MTLKEFSDAFDAKLNSYSNKALAGEEASKADIILDEYEKSLFLTQAQQDIVISYYNGKNIYEDSFESSEETRRYLDELIKTKVYYYDNDAIDDLFETSLSDNSVFFELPEDLAFITLEQVTYDDENLGCYDGTRVLVYPVTQDEYNLIKDNPFRGPTKYKVLRLDYGDNIVELISKYHIGKYIIKYLSRPKPIILENLQEGLKINNISSATECALNPILHEAILDKAVLLAIASRASRSKE